MTGSGTVTGIGIGLLIFLRVHERILRRGPLSSLRQRNQHVSGAGTSGLGLSIGISVMEQVSKADSDILPSWADSPCGRIGWIIRMIYCRYTNRFTIDYADTAKPGSPAMVYSDLVIVA